MSYIPSLTLPSMVFQSTPISILLPSTLGLLSGLVSQPGSSKPKSPSDETHPDRNTYSSRDGIQKKYKELRQPPFRPPPWVFAPAWTSLYILMGYASHRAWTTGFASLNPRIIEDTRRGATLYTIQLVLNQLFMPLFFGLGKPVAALVDVAVLTGSVGYLTWIWKDVDMVASYCMLPYVAWLSFATYLTASTGYLNGWSLTTTEAEEKKE